MKEAEQSLASKTEINNALDLGDKKRQKKKNFRLLFQVLSLVKVNLKMMGCKF